MRSNSSSSPERALPRTIDAHRDVGRLLVDRDADAARLGIEADRRTSVADLAHDLAREARNVDVGFRRHLAGDVDLSGDRERLDRDARVGIVFEQRVEHRIGDLIGELVGVPLRHRLAGKEPFVRHQVPSLQEAMYLTCSGVRISMSTPIEASFSRATSSSISSGTS